MRALAIAAILVATVAICGTAAATPPSLIPKIGITMCPGPHPMVTTDGECGSTPVGEIEYFIKHLPPPIGGGP